MLHTQVSVLAVDDSPDILAPVENFLTGYKYRVHTATNAPEALAMIRGGLRPTVLFTDIVMPGTIDGLELARIVRREYPEIGVLLMTGWSYDLDHDFPILSKPFRMVEITDWITAFLARAA